MASPGFFLIWALHSLVALMSGALMMLHSTEISAIRSQGSLSMVAFMKGRELQSFFAKGCVVLHVGGAVWRFFFERKLEELVHEWPKQVVGDIVLAVSWIFFLVYSWREKYN